MSADECACVGYTIRTDYGTGIEHGVDQSDCLMHGEQGGAAVAAFEAVLTEYGVDDWTAYDTHDIGPAFDAGLVRFLIADLRAALADPAGALAKVRAETLRDVEFEIRDATSIPIAARAAICAVIRARADRIEAQP